MGEQAEWLARRSRRAPTPEWDNRPRLASGVEPYWRAFQECRSSCAAGVAISPTDVRSWCELMGVHDRDRQGTYFRIIRRMDDVVMRRHHDAATAAARRNK